MSTTISITPPEIRDLGGQFKSASSESQEMVQRLESAVSGAQPKWQGMASQRFYGDFDTWRGNMRNFIELLARIGQELDVVANTMEETDRQLASRR